MWTDIKEFPQESDDWTEIWTGNQAEKVGENRSGSERWVTLCQEEAREHAEASEPGAEMEGAGRDGGRGWALSVWLRHCFLLILMPSEVI